MKFYNVERHTTHDFYIFFWGHIRIGLHYTKEDKIESISFIITLS